MAYYSSEYYEDFYVGESYQTPYCGSYQVVPLQAFLAHPSHEFSNENFFGYNLAPYYGDYDPAMNRSVVAYSMSTYSEPKSIVYDVYNGCYSPEIVTQFRVSHSASVLNDHLDFKEYDPTPYDGGSDLAQTYGKPLPPSEAICYPRSIMLDSSTPPLNSNENPNESTLNLIPYIENIETPANKDEQQQVCTSKEDQLIEYKINNGQDDNPPRSDHEVGYDEDNSYEYEKIVSQIPSGYGLEAIDLCESIFGYWPCLAKYDKRGHDSQQAADYGENNNNNKWKQTADYLFGSSYPYEERNGGDVVYSYQRRDQAQPLSRNVKYEQNSWMSNIF